MIRKLIFNWVHSIHVTIVCSFTDLTNVRTNFDANHFVC